MVVKMETRDDEFSHSAHIKKVVALSFCLSFSMNRLVRFSNF